jgi:hypothetical protein
MSTRFCVTANQPASIMLPGYASLSRHGWEDARKAEEAPW